MKKILVLVLAVVMLFLCGCGKQDKKIEKPQDTNLELWILQDVKDFDFSSFTNQIYDVGVRIYYGSKYKVEKNEQGQMIDPTECVKYSITAYPDYADGGSYVTNIVITDPTIVLFGLTINSTFEEFDAVFEEYGCEMVKQQAFHSAEKDGVKYSIRPGKFIIDAKVENRLGITM